MQEKRLEQSKEIKNPLWVDKVLMLTKKKRGRPFGRKGKPNESSIIS